MPGVFVAPFPYAHRYGWEAEETSRWCLEELEYLLLTQTAPEETAAFLIEPVLGEGGYVVPPASFMKGLRALADEHGILLICDEIQSGFGRTGRWFGYEHFDIRPDILTMAKGLASGMPILGIAAPVDLMAKWAPGSHGGTYGGNAVAAAAPVATIRTLRDEKLIENSWARGAQLMAGLSHIREAFPQISDVRGLGLMVGAEFRSGDRKPDGQMAKVVAGAAFERGLMLLTCGPWGNVVRWIPPLIVTHDQINEALGIFQGALG